LGTGQLQGLIQKEFPGTISAQTGGWQAMIRLGIDVGGTFTDVILFDGASGRIETAKVATTPDDPSVGAAAGVHRTLVQAGFDGNNVAFVGHGTTIATNLLIEGKGARTALLTTRGFRDILEIRRLSRHDRADLYDLFFTNPAPLVPRRLCHELDERILYDGSVEHALDPALLDAAIEDCVNEDIEALALCLINAPVNSLHERQAADRARSLHPDLFVTASCEVNPEIHEYERMSTTVINAMLGPKCTRYLEALSERFKLEAIEAPVHFMQSNGGLATAELIVPRPSALLESGPAGGVTAALALCRAMNTPHAITGDMGGTTFDVSLIRDFRPEIRHETRLHSHVVRMPTLAIESIGAGGGSIAWVDAGGGLRVGPESAGADPGPACYARGGENATVTDCNLVLGYLDPGEFLGGEFSLDAEAAQHAVDEHLAKPLGMDIVEAAQAVRALANALMAQAMRLVTVERGIDPRDCLYIAYGGAGPIHAIDLANELDISHVVVPPLPGLFSACGMLIADMQQDHQTPVNASLAELDPGDVESHIAALEIEATGRMAASGIDPSAIEIRRRADCCYLAQAETITIDLAADRPVDDAALARLADNFAATHRQLWNFDQPGRAIVLVNLRIEVIGRMGGYTKIQDETPADPPRPVAERGVHLASGPATLPVFARADLGPGNRIDGPAVVCEPSSAVVLLAGQSATLDSQGNLVIDLSSAP
jgi:N-methylhydantoinase A